MDHAKHIYVATDDPILRPLIEAFENDLEGKVLRIEIDDEEDEFKIGKLISSTELTIKKHYKEEKILKIHFSKPLLVTILDQVFDHYIPVEFIQN